MAAIKLNMIVRSFSSSTVQYQLVKTPVPVFGVNGRYASALYSAGIKSKEIDKIEADFIKFQDVLNKDKRFSQVVRDPSINKTLKAQILKDAASKLSFSKISINALNLIAENGRLKQFSQILSSFKTIMVAHRGEISCEIISAKPLTEAQKKELKTALNKFTKGKQSILMTTKVDPKIIGGLIVSIGDKYVDMSISSKIKKYTDILKSVV